MSAALAATLLALAPVGIEAFGSRCVRETAVKATRRFPDQTDMPDNLKVCTPPYVLHPWASACGRAPYRRGRSHR
jgi:hypothetical protein